MKKVLIISHTADIDGLGSVVLGKTIFNKEHDMQMDYSLVEFSELDSVISKLLETESYLDYDTIYITDVAIREDTIRKIEEKENLKSRIKHFDHHASEIKNNSYSFINEVLEENGEYTCGTSLFYNHICREFDDKVLGKESTKKFVEAVRCRDNWLKELPEYKLGCDLTELQLMKGNDDFIGDITNSLLMDTPMVSKSDRKTIDRRNQEIKDYIDKCDKNLIFMELDGRNVGVSFSEQFRSEVGNALSAKYVEYIDCILIVNFSRNQYSFRTVKDDVDVSLIASSISPNGGGHPKAAGASITKDNYYIIVKALEEKYNKNKIIQKQMTNN